MLFDKTAVVSTQTRNTNMVTTRTTWPTISCNIQPAWSQSGFSGSPVYNQYVMYCETMTVKEWDKVVSGWETYVVKDVEDWKWVLRQFLKVTMEKSRWN